MAVALSLSLMRPVFLTRYAADKEQIYDRLVKKKFE